MNRRVVAAALLAVSTVPPMLPRTPWVQAAESAVLGGAGWLLGSPGPRRGPVAVLLTAAWVTVTLGWQILLWSRLGVVPAGFVVLSASLVLAGVLMLAGLPRGPARCATEVLVVALGLALHRGARGRAGADLPRSWWLPVLSFLQTSVDLLGALDVLPGHGHHPATSNG